MSFLDYIDNPEPVHTYVPKPRDPKLDAEVDRLLAMLDDDDSVTVEIKSAKPTRVTVEIAAAAKQSTLVLDDAIAAALAVVPSPAISSATHDAAQKEKEEIEALLADKDPHIGLSPDDLAEQELDVDIDIETVKRCGEWRCPTCRSVFAPRSVSMDSDLMYTLDWMLAQPDPDNVGVTAIQGCKEPKVIGDRYYGKLKYWGLTKMIGQGRYRVTDLARRYAAGLVSIPDAVSVLHDRVISVSDYEIDATTARARVKSRGKKKGTK